MDDDSYSLPSACQECEDHAECMDYYYSQDRNWAMSDKASVVLDGLENDPDDQS